MVVNVVERFKKELMLFTGRRDKKSGRCREVAVRGGSTVIDVDFYGES